MPEPGATDGARTEGGGFGLDGTDPFLVDDGLTFGSRVRFGRVQRLSLVARGTRRDLNTVITQILDQALGGSTDAIDGTQ